MLSLYNSCLLDVSDIQQLLPILKRYASKCSHITEFGVRTGNSTWALLDSCPETLISYDIVPLAENSLDIMKSFAAHYQINFQFRLENVLDIDIAPTELLFIDTLHTYKQLSLELRKHSYLVSKYIILHDTVTYGLVGEDGTSPALEAAVMELLHTKKWVIREHHYYNNGMTVLERVE